MRPDFAEPNGHKTCKISFLMPNETTGVNFRNFLLAFTEDWLTLMSGAPSVPFLIAAMFAPGLYKTLFVVLALSCVVFSSYRVWRKERERVISLKVRPYNAAQQRLVRERIAPLGGNERAVLRYLLQHGEREQQKIFEDSGMDDSAFGPIFTAVVRTNLLNREERLKAGRAGTDFFWWVNPEFVEALKDELFPREEGLAPG